MPFLIADCVPMQNNCAASLTSRFLRSLQDPIRMFCSELETACIQALSVAPTSVIDDPETLPLTPKHHTHSSTLDFLMFIMIAYLWQYRPLSSWHESRTGV